MNRLLLFIPVFLGAFLVVGQSSENDPKKSVWQKESSSLKYVRKKGYQGPEDWYGASPSPMNEDAYGDFGPGENGEGFRSDPQRLHQERVNRNGRTWRGREGKGPLSNPKVKNPEPTEFSEIKEKEDQGKLDLGLSAGFWRVLLFLVIFCVIIALVYYWLKNRKPKETVIPQAIDYESNPADIPKSALEMRLEEALAKDDFREGVRIYFTFILKELIRKGWIDWKKEKTNYQYDLEMRSKRGSEQFSECLRIYELVWYGEYSIDKKDFDDLHPILLNYYRSLESNE